jgi:Fe-S cluster biogenesis protein NfuA
MKPAILGAIMDFYLSGSPLFKDNIAPINESDEEFFDPRDAGTVATIKELLEERVRPAVAADGGDISFKGFKDGIVYLAMKGSCAGCPSSTATLKHGIQNLMKHFLPDVREVQAI